MHSIVLYLIAPSYLAAKFYLGWGKAKIAATYMQEAYYAYVRWGATAKTQDLERRYPSLLAPILQARQLEFNSLSTLAKITSPSAKNFDTNDVTSFDLASVIQSAQALSGTIELDDLIEQLSQLILKNAGAQTCIVALPNRHDEWQLRSISTLIGSKIVTQQLQQPLIDNCEYPANSIHWVKNTRQTIVGDARQVLAVPDRYLLLHQPQSVFCLPIVEHQTVLGVLYLEHRHAPDLFAAANQMAISFLCTQAAIALANAKLYQDVQESKATLKLQQSYLAALLDNIPHLAWIKDRDARFIAVNQSFGELAGCVPSELVGKNDLDCWPLELAQQYRADDFVVMQSGHRQVVEERLLNPQGETRWIETTKTPIRDCEGEIAGTAGIAVDITDRKAMEIALRESEQRYHRLISNVPGALYQFELAADGTSQLKYISARCTELFELSPQAAMADLDGLLRQICSEDRQCFDRSILQATKVGGSWVWERQITTPSGQLKWIRGESCPTATTDGSIAWDGILMDVTDRKQAEIALRQSESRYQQLSDNIPGIIYQFRLAPDGGMTYPYVSSGFWELLKLTPAAVMADAHCAIELIHPADCHNLHQILVASARDLTPLLWEGRMILHSGEIKWIKKASRPELQADGAIVWDGVMLDITAQQAALHERQLAEIKLHQTNERLESTVRELQHATRLKDEFLATMSHELRTPLNAILGMAETLEEQLLGALNSRQLNSVSTIAKSGEHLLSLINDLLDVSKISAGKLELKMTQVSLTQLCKSSLLLVKQQAITKQIDLDSHLPADFDLIEIDERRMRQVLINLLNNAIKFTSDGGRVRLSVWREPRSNEGAAGLCFAITDTGIGISGTDLTKLFQPFMQIDSRLSRKYTGTGLGLVLVKQIVELHGGQIAVNSKVGIGSCFTIKIPQPDITAAGVVDLLDLTFNPLALTPQLAPSILLVEDNSVNIDTFSSYLRAKGYHTIVAYTDQQAISLAQSHRPDLILIDLQFAHSGIPAIEWIRQHSTQVHIPIIAIATAFPTSEREQWMAAGVDKYLTKPVKLCELHHTIQDCLDLN